MGDIVVLMKIGEINKYEDSLLIRNGWVYSQKYTRIVNELIHRYNVKPRAEFLGVFISSRFTRTLGVCTTLRFNGKLKEQAICLSKKMLEEATEEAIEDVLKHETAHLQCGGHGNGFRSLAMSMETDNIYSTFKKYRDRCKD